MCSDDNQNYIIIINILLYQNIILLLLYNIDRYINQNMKCMVSISNTLNKPRVDIMQN